MKQFQEFTSNALQSIQQTHQRGVEYLQTQTGDDVSFDVESNLDTLDYSLPKIIQKDHFVNIGGDDEIGLLVKNVAKNLNKNVQVFENSTYKFKLPPSGFQTVTQVLCYAAHDFGVQQQNRTFLNDQQTQDVWQTGTFKVQSNMPLFPYVWLLSTWIIKGRVRVMKSFEEDICRSVKQFYHIKFRVFRLDRTNSQNQLFYDTFFKPSMLQGIYNILVAFPCIISIFIGLPRMYDEIKNGDVLNGLERDRQFKLVNKSNHNTILFTSYNQQQATLIRQLSDTQDAFFKVVQAISMKIEEVYLFNKPQDFLQVYGIQLNIDLPVQIEKSNALQNILYQIIDQSQGLGDAKVKEHLISLIKAMRIIDFHTDKMKKELEQRRIQILKQVKDDHPYRSRIKDFYNDEVKEQYDLAVRQSEAQTQQQIRQDLQIQGVTDQLNLFNDFLALLNNQSLYKSKYKELVSNKEVPSRIFNLNKSYCKPYDVVKVFERYELKRERIYTVTTEYPFWRQRLFCTRWYVYTVNGTVACYDYLIYGPFGFQALCRFSEFNSQQVINDATLGTVIWTTPMSSVISSFRSVLKGMFICIQPGMRESRQLFENSPDDGFFGKSCARIINLIEVYLFRFLFVGVGVCLFCFTFLILLNIAFTTMIMLTMIVWVTLVMISAYTICYIISSFYSTFLLDFDNESFGRIKHDQIVSSAIIPIFYEIFIRIFLLGVFQIVWAGILLAIHIFLGVFYFVFAFVRVIIRSIYDCILFQVLILKYKQFIKCYGRIPRKNTLYTWKISGPGVSKISKEDLFTLIYAQLEQVELKEFQSRMTKLINQPLQDTRLALMKFFMAFNQTYAFSDAQTLCLSNCLNEQVSQRLKIYPNQPQNEVRFTEQELLQFVPETTNFIKETISKRNMNSYIWKSMEVRNGEFIELTKKLWKKAFNNSSILEPMEEVDIRIVLTAKSKLSAQIRRALEGRVNLEVLEATDNVKVQRKKSRVIVIKEDGPIPKCINLDHIVQGLKVTQNPNNAWNSKENPQYSIFINTTVVNPRK